jgi:hypothetical protein
MDIYNEAHPSALILGIFVTAVHLCDSRVQCLKRFSPISQTTTLSKALLTLCLPKDIFLSVKVDSPETL